MIASARVTILLATLGAASVQLLAGQLQTASPLEVLTFLGVFFLVIEALFNRESGDHPRR